MDLELAPTASPPPSPPPPHRSQFTLSPLSPRGAFHAEVDAFLEKGEEKLRARQSTGWWCACSSVAWILVVVLAFALAAARSEKQARAEAPVAAAAPLPSASTRIAKLAWGSCADQNYPQPYWDAVSAYGPDLLVLAGDNIYGDCEAAGCPELRDAYAALLSKPSFQGARQTIPMVATWDDHDFGQNDGGASNPNKDLAKALFLDFFQAGAGDMRRHRDGVYAAHTFGPVGERVQVILLDTRYFRSDLATADSPPSEGGPYVAAADGAMLGDAQWAWLENLLAEAADLRLLVSSVQVVADGHGWEGWDKLPAERERLYAALDRRKGGAVVALSGDRHVGGLYQEPLAGVVDATASSWTHTTPCDGDPLAVADDACDAGEPRHGSNRLFPLVRANHFGVVEVDWERRVATVGLRRAAAATGLGHAPKTAANRHLFAGALLQSVDVDFPS